MEITDIRAKTAEAAATDSSRLSTTTLFVVIHLSPTLTTTLGFQNDGLVKLLGGGRMGLVVLFLSISPNRKINVILISYLLLLLLMDRQ